MASSVDAFAVLRLSEKAMPTTENSRSTVADEAGQPRYCLAIRARFGKRLQCEGREMQQALSSYASQPLGLPLLATLVDRLLRRGRSLGRGLGLLAHHEPSGGREAEELWTALGILRQRKLLLVLSKYDCDLNQGLRVNVGTLLLYTVLTPFQNAVDTF